MVSDWVFYVRKQCLNLHFMMFMVSARNRLLKIVVSNNKQIRCFVVVILLFTLCQNVGMQPKYCRICNIVTLLYLKSNVPKYDLYFATRQRCFWSVRPPLSIVCSSGQILLPQYLVNGLSDLNETYTGIAISSY